MSTRNGICLALSGILKNLKGPPFFVGNLLVLSDPVGDSLLLLSCQLCVYDVCDNTHALHRLVPLRLG